MRVKDLDFGRGELPVRDGKGGKDRVTMLPVGLQPALQAHLDRVKAQHATDQSMGRGVVALPGALAIKYPNAGREWGWQWVFPATRFYVDAATGAHRRHHLHESVVQRAVRGAAQAAGIVRPVTCHSLRAFVCDASARGRLRHPDDPGLLGHKNVSTTMIYTHVLNRGGQGVTSPLDRLPIVSSGGRAK